MPNSVTIPIPLIGPLTIHFYGIILMSGAVAAAWFASVRAAQRGYNKDYVWDALIWVLLGGVVGARIWHIFTPPPSMLILDSATGKLVNPYFAGGIPRILDMLTIWNGGLGIAGAVIGGVIALYLYCRRQKLSFPIWLDITTPTLALGQAIGRWGNFVNQEVYGRPTNLPWGIKITYPTGYPPETRFHPLFFYESLYNLANMFFLLWLDHRYRDKLLPGDLFLVYLIIYPVGRFLLDFIRLDVSELGGININQALMLATALVSTFILIVRHRKGSSLPRKATD